MEVLGKKLISFASLLEPKVTSQLHNLSSMPFIFPHVAAMPDSHWGKGAPVGSVIPTDGAIIPAAVGVDIGCGMIAMRTQWSRYDLLPGMNFTPLREAIERAVPVSKGGNNTEIKRSSTQHRIMELEGTAGIEQAAAIYPGWHLQLGSLGGGNHFIEVSLDEQERVWIFLHSGSRGVGNKLAVKHVKVAQEYMRKWKISLPDPDLSYLVETERTFWEYIEALRWAQRFALLNREEMLDRVADCLSEFMNERAICEQKIACHHNYTVQEEVHGRKVWLSRKGAIDAHEGVWGLIPGSMATASYVVTGKGFKPSLSSAPHGAGRLMARGEARRTLSFDTLKDQMKGIEWRESEAFLDESPGAYKPIDVVMNDASQLVTIEHELHQILNVKGD